jgi:hypothetical protein
MKVKNNLITLENFTKVPISDLIESVLTDINTVLKKGYKIDMSTWFSEYLSKECTVCLGGAAVMGFGVENPSKLFHRNIKKTPDERFEEYIDELSHLMIFFNALRKKTIWDFGPSMYSLRISGPVKLVISRWVEEYPNPFYSLLDSKELNRLKKELSILVKMLRNENL